jgi:hypothetical protein
MTNLSQNKETVTLNLAKKYIAIDGLYVNHIRNGMASLEGNTTLPRVREIIFPYTETPFAEFWPKKKSFNIDDIKAIPSDSVEGVVMDVFSTDTGLILLINETIFFEVISVFDYNVVVDTDQGLVNSEYWESIQSKFQFGDLALIVSPGMDEGVDFEGSGTYRIIGK